MLPLLTVSLMPTSDSLSQVIFVTSVDRALSESERQFLHQIKQWRKKVIVALSKIDILEQESHLTEILQFVRTNIEPVIGTNPIIFPVSSKLALQAKTGHGAKVDHAALWKASNFGELEDYILKSLDAGQRARIKLQNPLGVAENLIDKHKKLVNNEVLALQNDQETISIVDRNIDAFLETMRQGMRAFTARSLTHSLSLSHSRVYCLDHRHDAWCLSFVPDYKLQQTRLENVLLMFGQRGDRFIDQTLRLTNILSLLQADRIKYDHSSSG